MRLFQRRDDRRHRAIVACAASVLCALGIAGGFVAPAHAADLDVGAPDAGAYDGEQYQRPYAYPQRGAVYPRPDEGPIYDRRRAYDPPYRPRAWADPYGYRDEPRRYEAYRYDRYGYDHDRYDHDRPYAEMRPPLPAAPRGPYVDQRFDPRDDMLADEAPPPYGWRAPRW